MKICAKLAHDRVRIQLKYYIFSWFLLVFLLISISILYENVFTKPAHDSVRIQLKAERPKAQKSPRWILCRRQRISLLIMMMVVMMMMTMMMMMMMMMMCPRQCLHCFAILQRLPERQVDCHCKNQGQERQGVSWKIIFKAQMSKTPKFLGSIDHYKTIWSGGRRLTTPGYTSLGVNILRASLSKVSSCLFIHLNFISGQCCTLQQDHPDRTLNEVGQRFWRNQKASSMTRQFGTYRFGWIVWSHLFVYLLLSMHHSYLTIFCIYTLSFVHCLVSFHISEESFFSAPKEMNITFHLSCQNLFDNSDRLFSQTPSYTPLSNTLLIETWISWKFWYIHIFVARGRVLHFCTNVKSTCVQTDILSPIYSQTRDISGKILSNKFISGRAWIFGFKCFSSWLVYFL